MSLNPKQAGKSKRHRAKNTRQKPDTSLLASELRSSVASQLASSVAPHASHGFQGFQESEELYGSAAPNGAAHDFFTDTPITHEASRCNEEESSLERDLWDRGQYGELDLPTFIVFAEKAAQEESSKHENRSPIWEFARYCKSYPRFALLTGEQVFELIDWDMTEFDEVEAESFITCFDKVLFAAGEGPIHLALRTADENPLRKTKRRLYDRFVSMAGWLQYYVGDKEIYLPQQLLAESMNLPQSTISNMTNSALKDGYLTLVKKAIPHRRAALYRFDVAKFPILGEEQQ